MRIIILRTLFLFLFAVLAVNLFSTQVINGQYYLSLSEQNRIRVLPIPALRGQILDTTGVPLAENRPSYDISVIPNDFDQNKLSLLAKALDLPSDELKSTIKKGKRAPFSPVLVKPDAAMEDVFRLEELQPELEGVHLDIIGKRYYPLGLATGHLTGYIGLITPEEYKQGDPARFLYTDYKGRAGIESSMDDALRGEHGGRQIEVNSRGRVLRTLSEKRPRLGRDIRLSIHATLQQELHKLIESKRAVIGIMDIKTDGVLALVSTPSYDPNAFVTPDRSDERMEYLKSKENPMINQAVKAGFPLGSVFKLVVALGALQEGLITPQTSFHCRGSFSLKAGQRPFRCWKEAGHGTVDLQKAIEQSCNVYFYETGKRLGVERIAHYARSLGLGSSWDSELGRMFPGLVPDGSWKLEKIGEKWYQGETLSLAIGQSYLLVSPLQVLRLVATIAGDGRLSGPRLVQRTDAEINEGRREERVDIEPRYFDMVRAAMRSVVDARSGTGQLARVDGLSVAGKTSTAQVPAGEAHSWFAGFAPADDPEVAIVVFVAHGGSGGHTAAPIAKSALEVWQAIKLGKPLPSERDASNTAMESQGGRHV